MRGLLLMAPSEDEKVAALIEFAEQAGMELHPWQREVCERIYAGERGTVTGGDKRQRQFFQDCLTAWFIGEGESVAIMAETPERREAARQRALAVLDRLDGWAGEPDG